MRRLLMAGAAVIGVVGPPALAQTPTLLQANPSQGQLAAPFGAGPATNNNNNAWGNQNTPTGSLSAGALSTIYAPNVDRVPAPGTIVIRFNGHVDVGFDANFTSANTSTNANGGYTGYKVNPLNAFSYAWLYPAFDGMSANGIRYGAAVEIRNDYVSGTYPGTLTGSSPTTTTLTTTATQGAQGPSGNTSGQTLFVRRAFTYIAADQVGILRLGQTDGVIGLFDNCIFTSQCWDAGSGMFNGGDVQDTGPSAALAIPFFWLAQAGAEYGDNKLVYLSPQVYGFDVGIQYAPNEGNSFQNQGIGVGCVQAGPTCISVTSGTDPTRWYNQVGAGLRWQQSFGPVDVKAYGFWETAGKESVPGSQFLTPAQFANRSPAGIAARTTANVPYDNLNFHKAGVAVTTANITVAADYIGGDIGTSGQLTMKPAGGVNANALLVGVTYANGPVTLGVAFAEAQGQGAQQLVGISQRQEYEATFGGAYKLAPGLQFFAEYMYEHRHQGDYNFATGTAGSTHDVQGNSVVLGTMLTW